MRFPKRAVSPASGALMQTLHPSAKLLGALIFIVTVVSYAPSAISGLAGMIFYPALLLSLAGLSAGKVLARAAVALPFALALGVSNIFFERTILFSINGFAVTGGMVTCVSLLMKAMLTVSCLVILSLTTPFSALIAALSRAGMPKILALQFNMTERYISVLTGEASAMLTAYQLRSRRSVRGVSIRDCGSFLGQLLLRGFDRAGRVYEAMRLRGFDGVFRTGDAGEALMLKWRFRDTIFLVSTTIFVLAARFFPPLSLFIAFFAQFSRGIP